MQHRFLIGLAGFVFSVSVLFLALTAASAAVFGTPQTLKTALKESGAYDTASSTLAKQASSIVTSQAGTTGQLPVDSAAIDQAAKASFTSTAIESDVEKAIDSTYAWLDGETTKPDIRVNLQPYVNSFTQSIGDQAMQRVQKLPVCTTDQLRQLDPNNLDLFNLPCQPPGLNLSIAKDQTIAKATQSNDFLKNPQVSTDTLPKDTEGKTAVDRAAGLPMVFQWSMRAPWVLAGLALVCVIAILALAWHDKRLAIRKIAKPLLIAGVTLAVIALFSRLAFSYVSKPEGLATKLAGGDFKDVILAFMDSIQQAFTSQLLTFAAGYIAVGAIALLAVRFIKPPTAAEKLATAPAANSPVSNETPLAPKASDPGKPEKNTSEPNKNTPS